MTKKSNEKFPNKWAEEPDNFDFNPGGRPAQIGPKKSSNKQAPKKEALKDTLKDVLGKEQK
jgi:hypothetical protein